MAEPAMRQEFQLDHYRDEEGNLLAYAWPGGYPVYYLDADGCWLCPDCARRFDDPEEHGSFAPVAGDIYWEGPPLTCDECGAEITSAYGDPEQEEE